jgi:hypothetical protein
MTSMLQFIAKPMVVACFEVKPHLPRRLLVFIKLHAFDTEELDVSTTGRRQCRHKVKAV